MRNGTHRMKTYCYLSLIPEALIASALDPEEFALYYATGSQRSSRSQALFFEVDPALLDGGFPVEEIGKRGMIHTDGTQRRSLYLAVYRVLERVPLESLGKMFLTTAEGRLLGISAATYRGEGAGEKHLYQELSPVTPLIVSTLQPREFGLSVTDPGRSIYLPRIVYCDLDLGPLSTDSEAEMIDNLPYPNIDHLKDCIRELDNKPGKTNKTVHRGMRADLLYRTVKAGFFLADREHFFHYPMPSLNDLETEYFDWWRSAQKIHD